MKKLICASVFMLLVVCLLIVPVQVYANVYAAQLKASNPDGSDFDGNFSDGTGALLSFILNDAATAVSVSVRDLETGTEVASITAGALSRGSNSVEWDGTGSAAGRSYFFEVTAEQANASITEWTVFFDSGDIEIFTRGVDVVRDQSSSLFGLIYAPNTGGALEKGITIYNPDGSFHDPFLVAADISAGGSIDWGGGADPMFGGVLDDEERFYVSAIEAGEVRRLNTDNSLTTVISGLVNPKGLYMVGTGADRVLYVCDDTTVVRAAIGNDEVFSGTVELIGTFSDGFPRNIALDDEGSMYVSFRENNQLNSEPVSLNKYEISGALPVTDNDAFWFINPAQSFRVADLWVDHGDPGDLLDDILYYSTRAGEGTFDDGVWRVDDLSSFFPTVTNLIDERDLYGNDDGANIQDRAAIAQDAAGNIILMENANEHVFFLSPPGEGATNSFTTSSPDTMTVGPPVSVGDRSGLVPDGFRLGANYPNPFNPSTTVIYTLDESRQTTLTVFNVIGEEIRGLVDGVQVAGEHSVVWDGKDNFGNVVSSGVYLLVLKSGEFSQSRRMTLLK